jgi:hypothetical protein
MCRYELLPVFLAGLMPPKIVKPSALDLSVLCRCSAMQLSTPHVKACPAADVARADSSMQDASGSWQQPTTAIDVLDLVRYHSDELLDVPLLWPKLINDVVWRTPGVGDMAFSFDRPLSKIVGSCQSSDGMSIGL